MLLDWGFILFSIVSAIIVIFGFRFAKRKTKEQPKRTKFIVWGLTAMLVMAPFLTVVIGLLLELMLLGEGGGWMVAISFIYLAPTFFVIGLVLLIIGLLSKKQPVVTDSTLT